MGGYNRSVKSGKSLADASDYRWTARNKKIQTKKESYRYLIEHRLSGKPTPDWFKYHPNEQQLKKNLLKYYINEDELRKQEVIALGDTLVLRYKKCGDSVKYCNHNPSRYITKDGKRIRIK